VQTVQVEECPLVLPALDDDIGLMRRATISWRQSTSADTSSTSCKMLLEWHDSCRPNSHWLEYEYGYPCK